MLKKQTKIPRTPFRGVENESDEELYILYWLFELQDLGYIRTITRADSFILSEESSFNYTQVKVLKTKTKTERKKATILEEHIYTPDFIITWTNDADKILFKDKLLSNITTLLYSSKPKGILFYNLTKANGDPVTLIEVKPSFDKNNMIRLFKLNQKWMYDKLRVYVNLCIPQILFAKTFTPTLYLKTNKTGKDRKMTNKDGSPKWNVKTLQQWLDK